MRWGRELPPCERWVVEGAGGALVPLNEAELVVDIPSQMGWPVLLVASTKLGGINETLLSVEALRRRSISLLGVVSVGRPCASYASAMGFHAPEVPVHHVETFDRPFHFTADRPAHALASWLEAQEVRR